MLKVTIPSGETEALLTNLPETLLPLKDAAQLYFKRWAVQTIYDAFKSKPPAGELFQKTEISIQQDLYATVYLASFAMICAAGADEIIEHANQYKNLKYRRKSNLNRTIAYLRQRLWRVLLEDNPSIRRILLDTCARTLHSAPNLSDSWQQHLKY